jgi:hypothetical protein
MTVKKIKKCNGLGRGHIIFCKSGRQYLAKNLRLSGRSVETL